MTPPISITTISSCGIAGMYATPFLKIQRRATNKKAATLHSVFADNGPIISLYYFTSRNTELFLDPIVLFNCSVLFVFL
jgi:hypothetical protein